MRIEFTVLGLAKPGGSKTAFAFKRGDDSVGARVVDACKSAPSWKYVVASAAREAYQGPLLMGALNVSFHFYFPRPKGHFGKKGLKPSAPLFLTKRPDALKLARCTEDAMTGVVYADDSQIVQEYLSKQYGEPARAEVVIESLE